MRFEIYLDMSRQYRWRLINEHSYEIAVSSDGYYNKTACKRYIELVQTAAAVEVRDLTEDKPRA